MSDAPAPRSVIGGSAVGGLTDIGFVPGTDDLLVVSSQGRGLFDTLTSENISRHYAEFFKIPIHLASLHRESAVPTVRPSRSPDCTVVACHASHTTGGVLTSSNCHGLATFCFVLELQALLR